MDTEERKNKSEMAGLHLDLAIAVKRSISMMSDLSTIGDANAAMLWCLICKLRDGKYYNRCDVLYIVDSKIEAEEFDDDIIEVIEHTEKFADLMLEVRGAEIYERERSREQSES